MTTETEPIEMEAEPLAIIRAPKIEVATNEIESGLILIEKGIANDDEALPVRNLERLAADRIKLIHEKFEEPTSLAFKAHRAMTKLREEAKAPWLEMKARAAVARVEYETEKRRVIEAEQRRIAEEEQARRDAEAQELAEQQEAEAEKARAQVKRMQAEVDELQRDGQAEEAARVKAEAESKHAEADERDREANRILEEQANAPMPDAPPAPTREASKGFTRKHVATVTNANAFYGALAANEHLRHLAPVHEAALNRHARDTQGQTPIDGVHYSVDLKSRAS